MGTLTGKHVCLIIAPDKFRDEELLEPKSILEQAGVAVTVASSTRGRVTGMLGAVAQPDCLLSDVDVARYDALIFVGGSGAGVYYDNPTCHRLAQQAAAEKIVGAICIAPVILARAGILQGKMATVWSSEIPKIQAGGAQFSGEDVTRDGNIITGSGPQAAATFGKALVEALSEGVAQTAY